MSHMKQVLKCQFCFRTVLRQLRKEALSGIMRVLDNCQMYAGFYAYVNELYWVKPQNIMLCFVFQ